MKNATEGPPIYMIYVNNLMLAHKIPEHDPIRVETKHRIARNLARIARKFSRSTMAGNKNL